MRKGFTDGGDYKDSVVKRVARDLGVFGLGQVTEAPQRKSASQHLTKPIDEKVEQ
jgi:hypothetical protein